MHSHIDFGTDFKTRKLKLHQYTDFVGRFRPGLQPSPRRPTRLDLKALLKFIPARFAKTPQYVDATVADHCLYLF